jgi:hypothetical protein
MMSDSKIEAQERGRAVAWAVNTGRIPLDRAPYWLDKLKQNPENRTIMAALAPGLIPGAPRTVAAADLRPTLVGGGTAPPPPPPASRVDAFGFPVADIPAPVVIQKGKPVSEWTPSEQQDAMLRRLGQKFWPGTKPPPAGDTLYFPSPDDVSEFDESTGRWVEKNPYREV